MTAIKEHFEKRKGALIMERASFMTHWRDLSDFVAPRRGRFLTSDRNKGDKRNTKIINSAATMALRTLSSGMMAGITSPARPWFRLATPDSDMMEFEPVKIWLGLVEQQMREIFNQSNLYNVLPSVYRELGQFGTGCMSVVEDFKDVIRCYPHTVGSYLIANGDRCEVDTLYREFEMTVGQMASMFGVDKLSTSTRNKYEKGSVDLWVPVVHAIEPNDDRDLALQDSKNKAVRSVYYEPGNIEGGMLREKGFDEFPSMAPRWDVTGEDIYGTDCPGMTALGDVKMLQVEERRKAQAIDKMASPPLTGPPSLKNVPVSSLPGGLTVYDGGAEKQKLEPMYMVNPRIGELMADINSVEARIERAYYADLFLMLSNMEGVQPRNVMELSERKEEKLLMLGPVLERLHGELLNKLIDRTFGLMVKANILPPAPKELQGKPLKVEYISVLAQAQRAVGVGAIERLTGFISGLVTAQLTDGQKFDADQAIDEYGIMIGVSPKVIVPDDKVAQKRADAARQHMAQQAAAMMQPAADAMHKASQTDMGGDSLLGRMSGAAAA